jgi:uncharacterized protein (DUF433 family)
MHLIQIKHKAAQTGNNPPPSQSCTRWRQATFSKTKSKTARFRNFVKDKISNQMNYGAINIDPETMGGTPVFTGTRVPIQTLFDYIEGGDDLNEFLDDYPSVSKEAAIQVLQMAKKTLTTEKMLHENFA